MLKQRVITALILLAVIIGVLSNEIQGCGIKHLVLLYSSFGHSHSITR